LGGIKGDVIDVGVLRTTLMECGNWVDGDLYNGRVVKIANAFVFKEPVFNYSGDFPFLWDEIKIPIKYGSDYRRARQILEEVTGDTVRDYTASARQSWDALVTKYLIEPASVDPMVTLVANDNWMEFTVRYVVDYTRRRATKDTLFSHIVDAIEQSDGRVALASATFQVVGVPSLDVHVRK
jgi:small-conductance mechanosensitive channel